MIVDISTLLICPPEVVEQHIRATRTMEYVAAPLVKFLASDGASLPERWEEDTYWVDLRMFGFIPLGRQAIVVSFPDAANGFILRDSGYSKLIKRWDHVITITPTGTGTLYRDQVTVEAGVFTGLVWAFAQLLFRHRQRRWRRLVANGFSYER